MVSIVLLSWVVSVITTINMVISHGIHKPPSITANSTIFIKPWRDLPNKDRCELPKATAKWSTMNEVRLWCDLPCCWDRICDLQKANRKIYARTRMISDLRSVVTMHSTTQWGLPIRNWNLSFYDESCESQNAIMLAHASSRRSCASPICDRT